MPIRFVANWAEDVPLLAKEQTMVGASEYSATPSAELIAVVDGLSD